MTTLTLSGVSKDFGPVPVLRDVTLSVPAATRTAIVGASGSGKTTLLRLVAGFERADAGDITLGGTTVAGPGSFVPAHRRGIGYVAQDGALFPHLTVEQNIRFGLPRRGRDTTRVGEVMELVSLDVGLLSRYPHEISGGQQQRVALARALAPAPQVILLDEPFSALDTGLRGHTRQAVIAALERSGVTTVLVTHDQDEAMSFGQQIGIIAQGRLVQSGQPAAVFDNPVTTDVAEFLGATLLLTATARDGHAECALGRIPIRHDRSDGGSSTRILLRPEQLALDLDARRPNAVVTAVQAQGSHSEVVLRVTGTDESSAIPVRVPAHEGQAYRPGMPVAVGVTGGAVLYPA